jgi:tRNA(fMet)-specific endonuclease VapC
MVSAVAELAVRVKQLEEEVRDLKTRLQTVPQAPWYRQILGTLADDPVFDEIVLLGQELRAAERKLPPKKATARQHRKARPWMPVVLDTDHLTLLQREGPEATHILTRLDRLAPDDVAATIVSFHEQFQGWLAYLNKARKAEHIVRAYRELDALRRSFQRMNVLVFDEAAQDRFSALRPRCRRLGTLDLRIASIALSTGSLLLSRNLCDFEQVPGLVVEDWTRPVWNSRHTTRKSGDVPRHPDLDHSCRRDPMRRRPPNLIRNPGFEEGTAGWNAPALRNAAGTARFDGSISRTFRTILRPSRAEDDDGRDEAFPPERPARRHDRSGW